MELHHANFLWLWFMKPSLVAAITFILAHNWLEGASPLVAHAVMGPVVEAGFALSVAYAPRLVPFLFQTFLGRVLLASAVTLGLSAGIGAFALGASFLIQLLMAVVAFGVFAVHAGLILVAVRSLKGVAVQVSRLQPAEPWDLEAYGHRVGLASASLAQGMYIAAAIPLVVVPVTFLGVLLHRAVGINAYLAALLALLTGFTFVLLELKIGDLIIERATTPAGPDGESWGPVELPGRWLKSEDERE